MDEPKVAVLRHYASPYYDPEKAHEYYMRTRELKGRSTTSLNDEGKKIWSYTKNNIKSEKAAKVKEEQEKRDQKITELREKAEATKEQISSRLKELNEALTQKLILTPHMNRRIRANSIRFSRSIRKSKNHRKSLQVRQRRRRIRYRTISENRGGKSK